MIGGGPALIWACIRARDPGIESPANTGTAVTWRRRATSCAACLAAADQFDAVDQDAERLALDADDVAGAERE